MSFMEQMFFNTLGSAGGMWNLLLRTGFVGKPLWLQQRACQEELRETAWRALEEVGARKPLPLSYLLPGERISPMEIEKSLADGLPPNFTLVDVCSGGAVQDHSKETYQRAIARKNPGCTVYCADIDLPDAVDSRLRNLYYRGGDLAQRALSFLESPFLRPLVVAGFCLPGDLGRLTVKLAAGQRAEKVVTSRSGVEYSASRWQPHSFFFQDYTPAVEETVQLVLEEMNALKSPFRHDHSEQVNNRISAGKLLPLLDDAFVLQEQGYLVHLFRKKHEGGPINWSRPDCYLWAERPAGPLAAKRTIKKTTADLLPHHRYQ